MWQKGWHDTNGCQKIGLKTHRGTIFKYAKNLKSESWFLISEGEISNCALTQGFMRHLPKKMNQRNPDKEATLEDSKNQNEQ